MMVQFDVKRVQKGTESFMVSFDFTKTPVTQIADYIIMAASSYKSSDIHFDPREDGMMVRFRIDGDLQDYTFVPKAYEKNLSTRLKLLANMNITESRLPQDGAIKGTFGNEYLDMRVSSLPLNEGEKIVIRILDYSQSLEGVDSLGFHPKNLEKIRRMMGIPNGIILTTGATGSGKSTTTYSMLQELNKPETNIITVEDPIEMNIEGINQVQVNAEIGMTFAAALRSILRQDPNIILIGEIRDSETAQIAVRASITGHLVLSTIHTNNTLATVERLLDMDVERYLLSTALTGIISQRLAKMLCPDCRYQRETTKYEKKVFKKYMNMDVAHVWDANPKGCEHCRRGYHGRIAIQEVLELDDNVRSALSNDKTERKELAKMVYSGNTITMLQDALIKCLEGKTSFEEVYKNIEIENEEDDNYENEMATIIKDSIPKDEYVPESDDLLDSPVKKKSDNDIVIMPPAFTAADFDDTPKDKKATEGQAGGATGQKDATQSNAFIVSNNAVQNKTVKQNATTGPQGVNTSGNGSVQTTPTQTIMQNPTTPIPKAINPAQVVSQTNASNTAAAVIPIKPVVKPVQNTAPVATTNSGVSASNLQVNVQPQSGASLNSMINNTNVTNNQKLVTPTPAVQPNLVSNAAVTSNQKLPTVPLRVQTDVVDVTKMERNDKPLTPGVAVTNNQKLPATPLSVQLNVGNNANTIVDNKPLTPNSK